MQYACQTSIAVQGTKGACIPSFLVIVNGDYGYLTLCYHRCSRLGKFYLEHYRGKFVFCLKNDILGNGLYIAVNKPLSIFFHRYLRDGRYRRYLNTLP
jgi:hypothetical protein